MDRPAARRIPRRRRGPREQRSGPALVSARSIHQPPAGRLQVHRQVDEQPGGSTDQVGAGPASGQLREVRQVGQLAEHERAAPRGCRYREASRFRSRSRRPGPLPPLRRIRTRLVHEREGVRTAARVVRIVADPMTRSPSSGARPAPAPHRGRARPAPRAPQRRRLRRCRRARPCARTCTEQASAGRRRTRPRRACPRRRATSSASAVPTVTVRLTGEMSRT